MQNYALQILNDKKNYLLIQECFATFRRSLSSFTRDVLWGTFPHVRKGVSSHNGDKMTLNMAELASNVIRWQPLLLYT